MRHLSVVPAYVAPPVEGPKTLRDYAFEIHADWTRVHPTAVPYLNAMATLDTLDDTYGCDSATTIVIYFLANARSWTGDNARRIKKELNKMVMRHK